MKANSVKYRLALDANDYILCRQLMLAEDFDDQDLDFPTVMALDDDNEVVGFFATTPNDEMVLAGPLVMRHDMRRPRTAIQLIQLYETTLRGLGMKSYIFHTDPRFKFVGTSIKKLYPDRMPYAVRDGKEYYVWPLTKELAEEA